MSKNKGWVCDIWTLTKYSFYHGIGLDYQLISSSWCNLKIWGNNFTMQINIGLNKNAPFALKMFNANKSKHKKKKKSNLVISNLIKTLAEVVAAESSSSSWSSSCTQPIVTINPSKLSLAHAIATLSWLFFSNYVQQLDGLGVLEINHHELARFENMTLNYYMQL